MVIAQAEAWQQMGNRFRHGGSSFDFTNLIILGCVVAAFVIGLLLVSKLWQRGSKRPFRSQWRLFIQLCQAHQLSWREGWLLWRLAKAHGLRQPAALFVEPDRFSAQQVPKNFARWQLQINDLRLRLFQPKSGLALRAGPSRSSERVGDTV